MINNIILIIILIISLLLLFTIITNFFNKIEKFTSDIVYVYSAGLTGKYGKTSTKCPSNTVSINGSCLNPESSVDACRKVGRTWRSFVRGNCVDKQPTWCSTILRDNQEPEFQPIHYFHATGRSFNDDCCYVGGGTFPNAVPAHCD